MLGEEKISFWEDTWLENQPLLYFCSKARIPSFVMVEEFWSELSWIRDDILDLLDEWGIPREVSEKIMNIPIVRDAKDIGRCPLLLMGTF